MLNRLGELVRELRRRKVIQAAGWYLGVAFVSMQVVEAVFPYLPLSDPDRAGSIVLALLAGGFPVAMAISWLFDITPQGVYRESSEDDRGLGVAVTREADGEVAEQPLRPDSVAVLPFDNLSNDPENEYFSDGITDDIIMAIAHIQGLRVLCRASVMMYKTGHRGVGSIARELGVGTVVRGSVRRAGPRVRIVAEVIDPRTESLLWSERYDRGLEDIFEVQSDVAARIAIAVQRELSVSDRKRIETRGTANGEAYDLYLKARHLWNQRTEGSVNESLRYFGGALKLDPTFALAHSGSAEARVVLGIYGAGAPEEVLEAARASTQEALAIDPHLGEAVAVQACIRAIYDWTWDAAEQDFRRALELAPSYATAHQWYALNLLTPLGRFDEAMVELGRARELDPASSAIALGRGIVAFYSRDGDTAIGEFESIVRSHPRFAVAHYFLGQCHGAFAGVERGIEALETAMSLADESAETMAALGHLLAHAGRGDEAREILRRLDERAADGYVSPVLPSQILVGLGRTEEALDRLEEAESKRATDLIWLGVRPVYDPLRDESRFKALAARVGVA